MINCEDFVFLYIGDPQLVIFSFKILGIGQKKLVKNLKRLDFYVQSSIF